MKINQELVTQTFQVRNGTSGMYHDLDDVHRIQESLARELGVTISESEAIDFWRWRCSEWDGSWFGIDPSHTPDKDILDWFQQFIKFVGVETDEDSEDYSGDNVEVMDSASPTRVGVKVQLRDAEDCLWEVELDPAYHTQLLGEIEAQIPEKSESGTIRYSLEYDPSKVWSARKLEEK